MDDKKFTKLSNLVNNTFRVEKVWGYKWKMWDESQRRMLMSDSWQKDYKKAWQVDTDKGSLDLGSGQMATLLEAVCNKGEADINNKIFEVKSNGKTGIDIRYFFNPVRQEREVVLEAQDDYSDIDF